MRDDRAWSEDDQVTDEFGERVAPLIPLRKRVVDQTYTRKVEGGRKPKAPRLVFDEPRVIEPIEPRVTNPGSSLAMQHI